jgi:carboxymethylenebutenolidase
MASSMTLSRRAIAAGFFAGYAAAALSADAAPIHTDEQGLVVEVVKPPSGDVRLPAYLARPAAPGRHPAVIVVNEVFGIHDYIKDVCRRLAKKGFVAIAPALFSRAGDPAPLTDYGEIMKIVNAASDPQVLGDVGATLKFLQGAPYADASKIAITGFCWGGRIVWLACERFAEIRCGAAWYGQLAPRPGDSAQKLWPIDHAAELKAPVLGLYGGQDPFSAAVPAMREALAKAGKPGALVVYPDAGHGFHADYRASYVEADARDAWARMLAFFAEHGV